MASVQKRNFNMSAFVRNPAEGKLMGVAAGLADLTGVDALVIRLALILAALLAGPVPVILYIAAGLLADVR
jgi:phage shock protein C